MTIDAVAQSRICLVLGTSEGGVGAHVLVLARRLRERGADVVVCGPVATNALFDFTGAGVRFLPVSIGARSRPDATRRAAAMLRAATADTDLVHAHGMRAGFIALRAAGSRVPVVVTWHNAVLGGGVARAVLARIEVRIARGATRNLAVSPDLVDRIRTFGGRVQLAPVGAERPRDAAGDPAQVRAELTPADAPLVLGVGRLHEQKGFDILVDAAVLLAARRPAPVVAIAGDGPARRSLADQISRTGAVVRLLGRRSDVPELLAAADVVAMPSRWEGSPLAAHEAMFAGRPIVASAVGGLPELGAGGAIDLVPPNDATALAAAIARVLDDPAYAKALAERGAARALEWPDSIASAEAAIACYTEVLTA